MGDQENGPRVVGQGLFHVFDQRWGQVIGRLVQQEDVAGAAQQARQGQTWALVRGHSPDRRRPVRRRPRRAG